MKKKILCNVFESSFIRQSSVYLAGNVINAAIPFILLPILTRYLSPTDYGIVATSVVITQIVTVIVGLNSYGLIGRYHFDNDIIAQSNLVSTAIIFSCLSSVLCILILIPAGAFIESITKFPAAWVPLLVFISISGVIQTIYLSIIQARKEPLVYIGIQVLTTLLNLGLSLFFVVAIGMSWQGRMLAILITGGIIAFLCIYGLAFKLKLLRLSFSMDSLHAMFSFGIPLIPHFIGGWVMTMVARLYLNNMASVADTGLYSVGFNVASPIAMIVGAANQAYWPALFEKLSAPNIDKLRLARILLLGVVTLPLLAIFYGIAAYWFLPFIVGPKFYGAADYIFWLALAFAMQGVYFIFGNFIVYSKKTSLIAWRADFLAGVAILGLCPLFIYLNGSIGAAQSTFVAFIISTVGCFTASRKAYPMPWRSAIFSFVSFGGNTKSKGTHDYIP